MNYRVLAPRKFHGSSTEAPWKHHGRQKTIFFSMNYRVADYYGSSTEAQRTSTTKLFEQIRVLIPREFHGRSTEVLRRSTEAPRKFHGSTTEAPRKHHGSTTEAQRTSKTNVFEQIRVNLNVVAPRKFHGDQRSFTEVLRKFHGSTTEAPWPSKTKLLM